MKILKLLTLTEEAKKTSDAKRIANRLRRNQENLIDDLEKQVEDAEDVIETLLAEKLKNIDTDTFIQEYHKAKVDLYSVNIELKIAKETLKELYSDDMEKKD